MRNIIVDIIISRNLNDFVVVYNILLCAKHLNHRWKNSWRSSRDIRIICIFIFLIPYCKPLTHRWLTLETVNLRIIENRFSPYHIVVNRIFSKNTMTIINYAKSSRRFAQWIKNISKMSYNRFFFETWGFIYSNLTPIKCLSKRAIGRSIKNQ